jgi:cyclopropane-fatty-acyl-phospholipid synthase
MLSNHKEALGKATMRQTSTFDGWQESQSRGSKIRHGTVWSDSTAARKVTELLTYAGIGVNGRQPWDIQIHDARFFDRALGEGSIGVGESYMDGWWDVPALDEFFTRFRRADLASHVHDLKTALLVLKTRVLNLQTMHRAKQVAQAHYDLGNQLYEAMLDRRMQYTCAYWKGAATLDQAQENKLHLI